MSTGWSLTYESRDSGSGEPLRNSILFDVHSGQEEKSRAFLALELRQEQWHHVAVVYVTSEDGPGEARLFLDGVPGEFMDLEAPPLVMQEGALRIGGRPAVQIQHRSWPGLIHQVRLSTPVVYREENFQPLPRLAVEAGTTLALWSFDSCDDQTVDEDSGDGELGGNFLGDVDCFAACPDPSGN